MKGSSWDGLLLGAKILRLRPLLSFDELRRFVGRRWGGRLCERRGGWFWGSCEWQISTGQVVAWLMVRYGSWELCMLCEIRPFVHLNNWKKTRMISQLCLGCSRHDLHKPWFCPICIRVKYECMLSELARCLASAVPRVGKILGFWKCSAVFIGINIYTHR